MNHREIRARLADHAHGRLRPPEQAELERHLASCLHCREWLETYRLLGSTLAGSGGLEHPGAAELAGWAVAGADELAGPVALHLEACSSCRHEVELLQGAIAEARDGREPSAAADAGRSRSRWTPGRVAAAASLVLVVLAGILFSRPAGDAGSEEILSGRSLASDERIAARSIHAADVRIESGSHIVLSAQDQITFGEGFEVASGASLTVE